MKATHVSLVVTCLSSSACLTALIIFSYLIYSDLGIVISGKAVYIKKQSLEKNPMITKI